jgi:hypothetical protein
MLLQDQGERKTGPRPAHLPEPGEPAAAGRPMAGSWLTLGEEPCVDPQALPERRAPDGPAASANGQDNLICVTRPSCELVSLACVRRIS